MVKCWVEGGHILLNKNQRGLRLIKLSIRYLGHNAQEYSWWAQCARWALKTDPINHTDKNTSH